MTHTSRPSRASTITTLYAVRAVSLGGLVAALATGHPAWLLLPLVLLWLDGHLSDYLRDHWSPR